MPMPGMRGKSWPAQKQSLQARARGKTGVAFSVALRDADVGGAIPDEEAPDSGGWLSETITRRCST